MKIDVNYDITLQGDEIKDFNEYLEAFNIKTDKNYQIFVWGNAIFYMGEYDLLKEFNIEDIEIWEAGVPIEIKEELKKELIEAIKTAVDETRFYYENYDYGELYFLNEDNDEEEVDKLAQIFKEKIIKNKG